MNLKSISIKNFRNLDGKYKLSDKINLIIAPNGSGKTNFLEAIQFLATSRSFRTNSEINCINEKPSRADSVAHIQGKIKDRVTKELEVVLEKIANHYSDSVKKTLKVNGNRVFSTKFIGNFYSTLFSPNSINLISDTPSVRRRDLDEFLSLYDFEYLCEVAEYKKVVRSRNKLFEKFQDVSVDEKELTFWNEKLVELGTSIIYKRLKFINKVSRQMARLAKQLFNNKQKGGTKLSVHYISKFIDKEEKQAIWKSFAKKIKDNIQKEIRAGVTLYGPHREDIEFLLDEKSLREFGSRGEQRLCAFLYKIAQWEILSKKIGYVPMLLLDDLFSELDSGVTERVLKFLKKVDSQVVITTTHKEVLSDDFLKRVEEIEL